MYQGVIRNLECTCSFESVGAKLFGHQPSFRNLDLFVKCVTLQSDDFASIQQWCGDRVQRVGCGNERYLGEVYRRIDVVVDKGVVLFWVKNFEESGARITVMVGMGDLVNLVEKNDRVKTTNFAKGLNDVTGTAGNIGAAVTSDFSFVSDST